MPNNDLIVETANDTSLSRPHTLQSIKEVTDWLERNKDAIMEPVKGALSDEEIYDRAKVVSSIAFNEHRRQPDSNFTDLFDERWKRLISETTDPKAQISNLKGAITHLFGDTKSGKSEISGLSHGFTKSLNKKKNEYIEALSCIIPGFPLFTIENLADNIREAREAVLRAHSGGTLTAENRKLVVKTSLLIGQDLLPIAPERSEPNYPDFPSARVWLENQRGDIVGAARRLTEYVKSFSLSDAEIFSDAIRVAEGVFSQYQQDIGKASRVRFDGLFFREWFKFVCIQYTKDDYFDNKGHILEPGLEDFWKEIKDIPSLKKHKTLIERLLKVLDLYTSCSSVVPNKQDQDNNGSETYKYLASVPLWRHSVGVAREAMLQAKKFKVSLGDAIVAALAHDIGKLPKGMRWHSEEDDDSIALIGHAWLSSQRFLGIPGSMTAKHPFNIRDGIVEHHNANPVTPIGKLLAFCDKIARENELASAQKAFLANTNPNIRLRVAEIHTTGSFEQLVKSLPSPTSTEDVEQIKKAVKEFRTTWRPDGEKPSLAQTYQMVARAMGFKAWEALVAVAGKTDASSNCSHPAPVQNNEVDFLSWLGTLSPNITNNNILMVGMSGSGKTALIKQLVVGWANAGIGVDIVDLGNSHNGESPRNHGFCLFYNSDDFAAEHAAAVLACACESYFLSQGVDVGSLAIAQSLDMACSVVFEERGTSGSVDNVIAALTNLGLKHPNQKKLFKYISEALQPYSSSGRYKAFFSGVSGVAGDYKRNVVAWEMEPYLEHSEMAPVAYVAMLYKMLARIYYWKRQRRVVVIEEGWHVLKILSRLGKFSGNAVTSIFEDLFRATRMYGGGVLFTLQSLFDLEPFGVAGESETYASSRGKVIYANCPTKLLLHGHDYSDAVAAQRIELSQEELRTVEAINRSGVAYVQSTGFCGIIDFSEMR